MSGDAVALQLPTGLTARTRQQRQSHDIDTGNRASATTCLANFASCAARRVIVDYDVVA